MKKSLRDPNFDQNKISKTPNSIFVTRIPKSVDNTQLNDYFSQFGLIKEAHVARRKNGGHTGYGYIIAGS